MHIHYVESQIQEYCGSVKRLKETIMKEITPGNLIDTQIKLFSYMKQYYNQLLSWYFEPGQPQTITSGLNTNFTLSPSVIHFTSHHIFQSIYIPQALNTGTYIQQGDLFYSAGLHRNRCWPKPTQEKKSGEVWKNADEWTRGVETRKKSLAVSVACISIY